MYPFLFCAPHHQQRDSITVAAPTRVGLLLESLAIFLAFICHLPPDSGPGLLRVTLGVALGIAAAVVAWSSIKHLGRQFRVHAGLYHDHELIRSDPYAYVRHPIYSSLFAMLLSSILLLTQWEWAIVCVVLFIIGTEIRVHSEDQLLASRFGAEFEAYRRATSAYIPFVR